MHYELPVRLMQNGTLSTEANRRKAEHMSSLLLLLQMYSYLQTQEWLIHSHQKSGGVGDTLCWALENTRWWYIEIIRQDGSSHEGAKKGNCKGQRGDETLLSRIRTSQEEHCWGSCGKASLVSEKCLSSVSLQEQSASKCLCLTKSPLASIKEA